MKCEFRRALPVLLAFAVAGSVGLAQAPAPAKEPVVVGRFSVASLDALNKLITDMGLPMERDLNVRAEMEEAPFLGAGSVAMDKPLGATLVAGDGHKLEDGIFINVPVVPGRATAADQSNAGGKPLEGVKDTFEVRDMPLSVRRTADYLHVREGGVMGQKVDAWGHALMSDTFFSNDYKDAGNLFMLSGNVTALRKGAPEAYKELVRGIASAPRLMFGGGMGLDDKSVTSMLDQIDKFSVVLGQDDKDFHLKAWVSPSPFSTKAKEAPRPAFPAGMIMRMHIVYPNAEAAGYIEKQLEAMSEDNFDFGLPPVYHERVKELALRAAALNTATEAVSMAFAVKDGKPVFYLVDQFSKDCDAIKELGEIVSKGATLATEGTGAQIKVDSSTYTTGAKNTPVQRLVFGDEVVVDEIQTGRTLYMTISLNKNGKYVGELAGAGMDGKSTVLCAGGVDLGAAMTALIDTGGLPIPPDALQKLKTSLAGQGVTWTVQSSEQNYLYTDIQMPKQLVRELVKMYMTASVRVEPAATVMPPNIRPMPVEIDGPRMP